MIYLQLFLSYLKIGFFGFGGGYAMLSLIQHEVVISHQWISNSERYHRHFADDAGADLDQQRDLHRLCRDGEYLGRDPRYVRGLPAVHNADDRDHAVLPRFAGQPVYQKRDVRNAADGTCDDRAVRRGRLSDIRFVKSV